MSVEFFANPKLLWLLIIVPLMVGYYIYRWLQGGATITVSTTQGVERQSRTYKYYLLHLPFALRCVAVVMIIVAMARPQSKELSSNTTTQGIDIVLAIDVSSSMLARDFDPDRITAAKEVAAKFIIDRPNDRIGVVVFAGESFTQSPLTTDKRALINVMSQVGNTGIDDGTAIGNGLATSVNRLKESTAKSKVIILLTDGVNNRGEIAPLTAAQIAQTYNIRVYTIGVGSMGMAPSPTQDIWGRITFTPQKVEIDEQILTQIAQQTGGEYFRATNKDALKGVYDKINAMEKTKVEVSERTIYHELFVRFLLWAMALLVVEFVVRSFVLSRIP